MAAGAEAFGVAIVLAGSAGLAMARGGVDGTRTWARAGRRSPTTGAHKSGSCLRGLAASVGAAVVLVAGGLEIMTGREVARAGGMTMRPCPARLTVTTGRARTGLSPAGTGAGPAAVSTSQRRVGATAFEIVIWIGGVSIAISVGLMGTCGAEGGPTRQTQSPRSILLAAIAQG